MLPDRCLLLLLRKGMTVGSFFRCIKGINPHFRASMTFITHMTVDVSWRKQYCEFLQLFAMA